MTNTADKKTKRRRTGGASAPGSNERLRPPRTPSKTENAEIDKEDHIKERKELSPIIFQTTNSKGRTDPAINLS